jgi:uncharacterized iron-regulated protein
MRRSGGHVAIVAAMLSCLLGAARAEACKYQPGPFLEALQARAGACKHPLCGKIFPTRVAAPSGPKSSCADDPWLDFKTAAEGALSAGGVLILGETHDNSDHHLLQAAAVREFAAGPPPPVKTAVVFEQFRDDQQSGLDKFMAFGRDAARTGVIGDLKRFIEWDKSGWPKDIYDPLFQAVLDTHLAIYAGDVERTAMMKVAKSGEEGLAEPERKRLVLDRPLGAKSYWASVREIKEAHCNMLPASALPGMAYAQRYRDAHLADAVLKTSKRDGSAILIAGTGHARTDRGVPWYIRARAPEKKVVSVMFVEVEDGNNNPKAYVPRGPDGRPAADFLVFTARADHGDPCEKMRKK